ncbi:MAG: hypothetical protein QM785_10625 [Pyrinomonadaceae bacterium]
MEDLRREGADVSVASNSVPFEIAEKVRSKYFPKTEAAPKRAIKVIKAAAKPVEAPVEAAEAHEETSATPVETPTEAPVVRTTPTEPETTPAVTPSVKKLSKKVVAEPEPEPEVESPAPVDEAPAQPTTVVRKVLKPKVDAAAEPELTESQPEAVSTATEQDETPAPVEAAPEPVVGPGGTTVKRLTLSADALKKGIKAGDRLVSNAPTKTGSLVTPARTPGQFRGTPGENAAPQMTYTPPADNRRRPGRGGGRKNDKTGRFAERESDAPQKRSIEEPRHGPGRCIRGRNPTFGSFDRRCDDPRIC